MLIPLLLGVFAALLGPSLQTLGLLGEGAACGGWEWGECDAKLNLTCVVKPGTPAGDEFSEPTGICQKGPAPGCLPCSSVMCPPRRSRCFNTITEPCGCCLQCAHDKGELCGGPHWEMGFCERKLTCMQIKGFEPAVAPTSGVCKVNPKDPWPDKGRDPLCPWKWGCGFRAGTCQCWNKQTCFGAHSYGNLKDCEKAMAESMYGTGHLEEDEGAPWVCTGTYCRLVEASCECGEHRCSSKTHTLSKIDCEAKLEELRCRNVSCPEVPTPSCPPDSFLTKSYTPPGECCLQVAPMCTCSLESCPEAPLCLPGTQPVQVKKGNGHPGSCCDLYQCQ